jgi:Domain of unknown function (DUF4249)
MKRHFFSVLTILALSGLASCTDVIDVDLNAPTGQLNIDAWLTNLPGPQTIKLRLTSTYLGSQPSPTALGATVTVTDATGRAFAFTDPDNDGNYVWQPPTPNGQFGQVGQRYALEVRYQGQTYQATSTMQATTRVDAISYEKREAELNRKAGYRATLHATDRPELDNCYWIRTYKNGQFLNRPDEMNLAYDAGRRGTVLNNQAFLFPIAQGINPLNETDGGVYQLGDSIRVEIWSINIEGYDFLDQAQTQMTNGGLFATIPANVEGNIRRRAEGGTQPAVGFFSVSAVAASGTRLR